MPWLLLLLMSLLGSTGHAQELTLWHAYRGAERTTLEGLLETYSADNDGVTVRARAIPYDGFNTKLEVEVNRVTDGARKHIESAGGSVTETGTRRDRVRGVDRNSDDRSPKNLTKKLSRGKKGD